MNYKTVMTTLNISVLVLIVTAWLQSIGDGLSLIDVASLLGVTAFGLMWVHYMTAVIAPRPSGTRDMQYIVSRIVVLIAILVHPLLINIYLVTNDYGLPPDAYEKLVGSTLPVLIAWVALAAFISFELRGKLLRFARPIFHANILAMFLIAIHGFWIGMVLMSSWFIWVWAALIASFAVIASILYMRYYADNSARKVIAIGFVIGLTFLAGFVGFSKLQATAIATNPQPEYASDLPLDVGITQAQLAENDGEEDRPCWIAIDGTVYDASDNNQWQNGEHVPSNGRAKCGEDLSSVLSQAPHGREVLGELRTVGELAR